MTESLPLVKMEGICKSFYGKYANRDVDFTLHRGDIHALLGENGAGKTTLMNILAGVYSAESGTIRVNGGVCSFSTPEQAIGAGIGMVHQHFTLIKPYTVAQNIVLGLPFPRFLTGKKSCENLVRGLSEKFSLPVDPASFIRQLSVGEQQRVEILKLLARNPDILILDEPTAVLTPPEVDTLFSILRKLAAQGCGIVIITHKLREVFSVANRITVMRGGSVAGTRVPAESSEQEIASLMMGGYSGHEGRPAPHGACGTECLLELKSVRALNDRGVGALGSLDLRLNKGEILGIAGVAGNGQVELAEVICGLRRQTSGEVLFNGRNVSGLSPKERIKEGMAYIPGDRLRDAMVASLPIVHNAVIKEYDVPPLSFGPLILWKEAGRKASRLISDYNVVGQDKNFPAGLLSGGNQQKLVVGRELGRTPALIVAVSPTRGLDIGASRFIRDVLVEQAGHGAGVIVISEDLDELFLVSHRIAVLCAGRFSGIVDPATTDRNKVGLLMAGCSGGESCI